MTVSLGSKRLGGCSSLGNVAGVQVYSLSGMVILLSGSVRETRTRPCRRGTLVVSYRIPDQYIASGNCSCLFPVRLPYGRMKLCVWHAIGCWRVATSFQKLRKRPTLQRSVVSCRADFLHPTSAISVGSVMHRIRQAVMGRADACVKRKEGRLNQNLFLVQIAPSARRPASPCLRQRDSYCIAERG
jgi:hypothetical protein